MTLSEEFKVNDLSEELNWYIDTNSQDKKFIKSNTNVALNNIKNKELSNKNINNVELLNYNDAIIKSGQDINNNMNCKASRLGFNPTTINKMINKQIKNAA